MCAWAQNKFKEIQLPFWEKQPQSFSQQLFERSLVSAIDILFVEKMSKSSPLADAELLWLYLFAASRKGHLCVDIDSQLNPPLAHVFSSETESLTEQEEKQITREIFSAFTDLKSLHTEAVLGIYIEENRLYLKKNALEEKELWQIFERLENKTLEFCFDENTVDESLLEQQQKAIKVSLNHTLSLITGGPGVGKTYTASHLIQFFLKAYPKARVALVAPTGRAAAHLQSAFSKFMDDQDASYTLDVYTLHKLLMQKIYSYLPYDLILVDESSMIGLSFMLKLLKSIQPKSRLILLGDPDQLPPIDQGFVFKDFVSRAKNRVQLNQCMRVEKKELLYLAQLINEGSFESLYKQLKDKNRLIDSSGQDNTSIYERLIKERVLLFQSLTCYDLLFKDLKSKVILSALKKGPLGVERINQVLKEALSEQECTPILVVQNDYSLELFNGDLGIILPDQTAIFPLRTPKQSFQDVNHPAYRKIPIKLIPAYEHAYCISIHKSQGSEYHHVSVVLPPSSEIFGRSLLYTAVTRAKNSLEIITDVPTLQKTVENQTKRISKVSIEEINSSEQVRS